MRIPDEKQETLRERCLTRLEERKVSAGEIAFLLVVEAVSITCIVVMWRRHTPDRLKKDIFWTVVLLVPIFGPLLWGALYGGLPSRNRPRPTGTASGWTPHRRDL